MSASGAPRGAEIGDEGLARLRAELEHLRLLANTVPVAIAYYEAEGRMGLHQDKDEEDFSAPVLSVSLGDTGVFRVGGRSRKDPTKKIELTSGDVVVLGGDDRLAYHGIDRILQGTSNLIPEGGRFNLTLRRVTTPK